MSVEERCGTCDALLVPDADADDGWACPDCPDVEEVPVL